MEEPQPQELEELVQEMEEEYGAQESLPQEVEELLHVLQSGTDYLAREAAAERLGNVATSSPRVVRALVAAYESHSYPVSRAAAKSLRAPVHQAYLQQHPDLMEAPESALYQVPDAQESLSQEVEELLCVLQSESQRLARQDAAEHLGNVGTSSARIVRALITASESDTHPDVRRAATGSLRAPVHKEYLQQHPDVAEATERALRHVPAKEETGRGRIDPQSRGLIRCLVASPVAGLAVGLVIGLWDAEQSLFHDGGFTCGTGFLVALTVGAAVGAVVGAVAGGAVQERTYRILNMILGAVLAAVVASLSWFPLLILRVVQLGGP